MAKKNDKFNPGRRKFIREGAAIGVGATALAGVGAQEANAQARVKWDRTADVVIIGAGASGLPARPQRTVMYPEEDQGIRGR